MTEQPRTTAAVIRAAYPEPAEDSYCVLGAAALFTGNLDTRFPTHGQGAKLLQSLNPKLNWTTAMSFSLDTVVANDAGMFNVAWSFLDSALRYGHEE